LIFDKPKLYDVGEKYYSQAKSYLVAHNQEKTDEASREYRYKFPSYVNPENEAQPSAPAQPAPAKPAETVKP
jgi:NADH-quinone oxidoreductase subunit I